MVLLDTMTEIVTYTYFENTHLLLYSRPYVYACLNTIINLLHTLQFPKKLKLSSELTSQAFT
jgi:predicted DNA-binding transcriptional regulator AlpA